jgi:hypothetical protein
VLAEVLSSASSTGCITPWSCQQLHVTENNKVVADADNSVSIAVWRGMRNMRSCQPQEPGVDSVVGGCVRLQWGW